MSHFCWLGIQNYKKKNKKQKIKNKTKQTKPYLTIKQVIGATNQSILENLCLLLLAKVLCLYEAVISFYFKEWGLGIMLWIYIALLAIYRVQPFLYKSASLLTSKLIRTGNVIYSLNWFYNSIYGVSLTKQNGGCQGGHIPRLIPI